MSGALQALRDMLRARALGYTRDVYHGTRHAAEIDRFMLQPLLCCPRSGQPAQA